MPRPWRRALNAVNASAATGSNAVTVNASAFGNTLAITTGAGNDVITLGGGANVVVTGAGSDTVNGALSTGDTIDLGADNDIFDYRVTAASNFVDGAAGTADEITYSGGAKSFDFSTLLNNVTGEAGSYRNFENLDAVGATGAITAIAATTGSSIDTSSGAHNDVITLGAGTDIVNTFAGDDTVNATGTSLAGDTIDAGAGAVDTLAITGGGTVVMGAAVSNFEFVTLATATIFTANDTVGLTITGSGSGTDIITTGNAAQTVNAGSGNDIIIVGAVGQTIDAGNGNDTVVLSVARGHRCGKHHRRQQLRHAGIQRRRHCQHRRAGHHLQLREHQHRHDHA
jgi:Ca2+-binding RTX toxin-like protein